MYITFDTHMNKFKNLPEWNLLTTELLKSKLREREINHEKLRKLLAEIGVKESKASLANKLSRGTFSARFFLQALKVIGVDNVSIPDFSPFLNDQKEKASAVREPALHYGSSLPSWDSYDGFLRNDFEQEWYVDTNTTIDQADLVGGKVISLFTGCGGLDIGLERAGFETAGCVEIDEDCKETLRQNRPDWTLINGSRNGDIRYIEVEEILAETGLRKGEPALVVGGAPCQPFSNIGKRAGAADEKNGGDLFQEFVRVIEGCMPKAFIFENVVGITQQKHRDVIAYMKSCLSGLGYSISYRIMNAADYGVPQKRNRFILLGLKGNLPPALPVPLHYKSDDLYREFCFQTGTNPDRKIKTWRTVGEAFSTITESDRQRIDNVVMNISSPVRKRMELIGPGENFHVLPMEMRPNCWRTGKHQGQDTFGRLRMDEPSVTVRTAAYNPAKGRYIHPTENRGLSSVEMAVLQSFPSEWRFCSKRYEKVTLTSAGRQIGNAVPPLLAEAIGRALNIQLTMIDKSRFQESAKSA